MRILILNTQLEVQSESFQKSKSVKPKPNFSQWKDRFIHTISQIIPCTKLANPFTSDRTLTEKLGSKTSTIKKLTNGLLQGSVLAPSLFKLYTHDISFTTSQKFMYADNIALLMHGRTFSQLEPILNENRHRLDSYFKQWRLQLNPHKRMASSFHLNTRQASSKITLRLCDSFRNHVESPTYLGVKLDRSLTFRLHLQNLLLK